MLVCELEKAFPGAKAAHAVGLAVDSLKLAKCITWTSQGWLATEAGRDYVRLNRKLSFERRPA